MKRILFLILFLLPVLGYSQTIFTESIGSVGATTTIASHETANGFDNDTYTMSGSGDVRNTTVSSGYTGATGSANVFLTNTVGRNFQIEGISTMGATGLSLSFGALKSTTASNMSELVFEYSTDGTSYSTISIPAQPTGSGTAIWRLITLSLPVAAENQANLRLRWTNSSATPSFRLDDISLTYVIINTISTNTLTGNPFTVDCGSSASGTIDFTSTGTFGVGNVYTAQLSNASGSFASPISIGTLNSTANNGTINISIPGGTASGAGYRIRVVSSTPSVIGTDNGSDFTVTLNPCSITAGAVSSLTFNVDCTAGTDDVGTVDFTSSGTFDVSNNYIAQLSDETGSFSSPVTIGTLASSANSGTINITIPSTLSTGSGYRIRVISTNPVLTGTDNGSDITITQSTPCTQSLPASQGLLINEFSNGSATEKEYYEFVVAGQCGDIVDIRGYIIDDNNGTFSDVFPSTSGIAPGHLKLSNDAQWQFIPVGSLIVVYNADDVNSTIPTDDPNDSNFDSLYVIPHNHPTLFDITSELPSNAIPDSTYSPITSYVSTQWGPLSIRNAGDAVQVRTPAGDYFHGVSYGGAEMTGGPDNMKILSTGMGGMCGWFNDGDIFDVSNWSTGAISGNETPGLPNNAANLAWLREMRDPNSALCPITVLPTTAVVIKGIYLNGTSIIEWQTTSEQNNSHFTLQHSTNGFNFSTIGTVSGAGNSDEILDYRFVHENPNIGMNYYKLLSTDFDGKTYNKGIIALKSDPEFAYYNSITGTIELKDKTTIDIYSVDGKLVSSLINGKSIPFNSSGMFIIIDRNSGLSKRLLIP